MNTYLIRYRSRDAKRVHVAIMRAACLRDAFMSIGLPIRRRTIEIIHADEENPELA